MLGPCLLHTLHHEASLSIIETLLRERYGTLFACDRLIMEAGRDGKQSDPYPVDSVGC